MAGSLHCHLLRTDLAFWSSTESIMCDQIILVELLLSHRNVFWWDREANQKQLKPFEAGNPTVPYLATYNLLTILVIHLHLYFFHCKLGRFELLTSYSCWKASYMMMVMLWDLQMNGVVFMQGIITGHHISLCNQSIFFILLISIIQVSFIQNWKMAHAFSAVEGSL